MYINSFLGFIFFFFNCFNVSNIFCSLCIIILYQIIIDFNITRIKFLVLSINLHGFFRNRFHFKLNKSSSFNLSSLLINFLHPLHISLAVSIGMSSFAIVVRAVFQKGLLQISLILIALLQVARFW